MATNYKRNFILIHGTFAQGAKWVNSDSCFSMFLKSNFENEQINIDDFKWSGRNNHIDRLNAGVELGKRLNERLVKNPDEEQVLIGHSHGGNVALYALRHVALENKNKVKIVTLSTPFTNLKMRNISHLLKTFSYAISITFGSLLFVVGTLLLSIAVMSLIGEEYVFIKIFICALLVYVVTRYLTITIRNKVLKILTYSHTKMENELKEVVIDDLIDYNIYSATITFDEAYILLRISHLTRIPNWIQQIFASIQNSFYTLVERLTDNSIFQYISLIMMISCWYIAYDTVMGPEANEINYFLRNFILIGVLGMALASLFVYLSLINSFLIIVCQLIVIFFRANPLVHGWETFRMSLHCNLIISNYFREPNPLAFREYRRHELKVKRKIDLRHGRLYESPVVVKDFSNWIKKG